MSQHYEFELPPLPYPYEGLEPYIDAETVNIHHNKHLRKYIDNLNQILQPYPALHNRTLEQLLAYPQNLPKDIRIPVKRNAGGVYNHILYFNGISGQFTQPYGHLAYAITKNFGSMNNFINKFTEAALSQFASGYAWLVSDKRGKLDIYKTANQDTVIPFGLCPVLLIDVWEHAYYLKYKNNRDDYISAWFKVINWNKAEENYIRCIHSFGN